MTRRQGWSAEDSAYGTARCWRRSQQSHLDAGV